MTSAAWKQAHREQCRQADHAYWQRNRETHNAAKSAYRAKRTPAQRTRENAARNERRKAKRQAQRHRVCKVCGVVLTRQGGMFTGANEGHKNMSMTRNELFDLHKDLCARALETMQAKNRDYSGGTEDCFANFRSALFLGVEPEIGLLMRCMDKFKRVQAFVATGTLAVKNEPVDDAIEDVINYMVLLAELVKERRDKEAIKGANP